jgi:hypothetical protein
MTSPGNQERSTENAPAHLLGTYHDTAALVTSVCALALAAIYYLSRIWFSDNLPGPVLKALGLGWFLINFPFASKQLWARARTSPSWMASDGALSLVGLLTVLLLGMAFGKTAGMPTVICGGLFLLWRCRSLTGPRWAGRAGEVLCWGVLLGIALACWAWGDTCHDPLIRWAVLNGYVHRDELYFSTIGNMIRTYGVASSGLDGVPYIPHHWGAHFLLSQLGELLDLPGLDVYQLIYPVVFLPLLLHSTVIAGLAFARHGGATPAPRSLLIWPVMMVGFLGVVPDSYSSLTGARWSWDLISESMCTAAIVLQFGLAAGASLLRRGWQGRQQEMSIGRITATIGFPIFIAILGFLKISFMPVILGASTLVFLMAGPLRRSWLAALSLAIAYLASLGVVYPAFLGFNSGASGAANVLRIVPFAYLRGHVAPEWWGYYPLLELQILLPAVALRLRQEGCRDIGDLIRAWRTGALLDVGFAVFATAVGLMPGLVMDLSFDAAYFSHVHRWIALPILMGVLLSAARQSTEPFHWGDRLAHLPLWKVVAGLLLLSIGATLSLDTASRARYAVHKNLDDRGFPPLPSPDLIDANPRVSLKRLLRQGHLGRAYGLIREHAVAQQARRDARAQTIDILVGLYRLPREEKRVTLLHIPKTNRTYWDLLDDTNPPWVTPFVAPALSGLAHLEGLPDAEYSTHAGGYHEGGYGYREYQPWKDTHRQTAPEQAKADLCRKAEGMGFRRVLVLDVNRDGTPFLREWCFGGAKPILN